MPATKKYVKTFAFGWLVFVSIMALIAPLISNDKPLYVKWSNESKNSNTKEIDATNYRNEFLNNNTAFKTILFSPIPYAAGKTDADNLELKSPMDKNYYVGANGIETELPLRFHHFMGTDKRGCDVVAGIIHGGRYSLSIAFFAMFIATLIALLTGIVSGYFVTEGIYIGRIHFYFLLAGLFLAWFYGIYSMRFIVYDAFENSTSQFAIAISICMAIFITIFFLFHFAGKYFSKNFSSKNISIPVDGIISRITETFTAIPSVILIISVAAVARPSAITIILIFGFTFWTDLSRMVRAEVMKLKASNFVEAAVATGLTTKQIIFRHIIPNIFPVITPVILYGIAIAILTESGLSFLGLGIPSGTVTWGNLLAQGKENMEAWWLILFPGMFIFFTVNSLYKLGKKL